MSKTSILNQFSKYAKEYGNNNIIQQLVSKALVRDVENKPKKILELGCGSDKFLDILIGILIFIKQLIVLLKCASFIKKLPI